jgi:hypothetical protein
MRVSRVRDKRNTDDSSQPAEQDDYVEPTLHEVPYRYPPLPIMGTAVG